MGPDGSRNQMGARGGNKWELGLDGRDKGSYLVPDPPLWYTNILTGTPFSYLVPYHT